MRVIRLGIIGCGRIADVQLPGYLRMPEARVVAVCDLDPATAERRRLEWGAERAFTDPLALLTQPDLDAVEILTPHHTHRDLVLAACAAGKHVSVQKPMAMNLRECDEMIEAARQAKVVLRVYENFVHYPPYVKARELIEQGAIGEPLSIRLRIGSVGAGGWPVPMRTWLWRLREESCGGGPTVWDDGFHKFSVARHLLGPIESVHAWIDRSFGLIDSPAMVTWTHLEPGRTGCIDASYGPYTGIRSRYYPVDERVEILGAEGLLQVNACTARLVEGPPLLLHHDGRTIAFEDLRSDWLDSFVDASQHFVRRLLDGGEQLLSGERGRDVTRFALAALRSARLGRSVRIEEMEEAP
jgi:predicted dehydrogenase